MRGAGDATLYSPVADFRCFSLSFGNSVFSVQNVYVMRPEGWCCLHGGDTNAAVPAGCSWAGLEPPIRHFPEAALQRDQGHEGPASLSKAGAFWAIPRLPSDTELTFQEKLRVCSLQSVQRFTVLDNLGHHCILLWFLFITKEK